MISIKLYEQKISNHWAEVVEELINDKCKYYASHIMELLEMNEETFNKALTKAEKTLRVLNLPLKYNFRQVYLEADRIVMKDLKLSPLVVYFIATQADPENPQVARLQLYIARKYGL